MTSKEHQQIAEINALWRTMNKPKDIEAPRAAGLKEFQTCVETDRYTGKQREYQDYDVNTENAYLQGWDDAVAYLSEPGALRFLANETITKENDALKKRVAELEAK